MAAHFTAFGVRRVFV
nr:hypothetical protein [Vibrio cholerae]